MRTPLTSVIMVFEMTRDYSIIVPLMISNLTAFFISQMLQPEPIYEALATQDGVHLPTAESRSSHGGTRVVQVMRTPPVLLDPVTPISAALDRVKNIAVTASPIVNGEHLLGMVRHSDLKSAGASVNLNKKLEDFLPPGDLPHLHTDHTLSQALERMGVSNLHVLPRSEPREHIHELLGRNHAHRRPRRLRRRPPKRPQRL